MLRQFLQGVHVGTSLEKHGATAVSEGMGRHPAVQAGQSPNLAEAVAQLVHAYLQRPDPEKDPMEAGEAEPIQGARRSPSR